MEFKKDGIQNNNDENSNTNNLNAENDDFDEIDSQSAAVVEKLRPPPCSPLIIAPSRSKRHRDPLTLPLWAWYSHPHQENSNLNLKKASLVAPLTAPNLPTPNLVNSDFQEAIRQRLFHSMY